MAVDRRLGHPPRTQLMSSGQSWSYWKQGFRLRLMRRLRSAGRTCGSFRAAARHHRKLSFRPRKRNCGKSVDPPEGASVSPPSAFRMAYQPSPPAPCPFSPPADPPELTALAHPSGSRRSKAGGRRNARFVLGQHTGGGRVAVERTGLMLGNPNADQIAADVVSFGEPVEGLAGRIIPGRLAA